VNALFACGLVFVAPRCAAWVRGPSSRGGHAWSQRVWGHNGPSCTRPRGTHALYMQRRPHHRHSPRTRPSPGLWPWGFSRLLPGLLGWAVGWGSACGGLAAGLHSPACCESTVRGSAATQLACHAVRGRCGLGPPTEVFTRNSSPSVGHLSNQASGHQIFSTPLATRPPTPEVMPPAGGGKIIQKTTNPQH
jgi:hypothetical protein